MSNTLKPDSSALEQSAELRAKRILWLYDDRGRLNLLLNNPRHQFVIDVLQAHQQQLTLCPIKYRRISVDWRYPKANKNNLTCLPRLKADKLDEFLIDNIERFDVIWISQAHLVNRFSSTIYDIRARNQGEHSRPKVVYDAGDDIQHERAKPSATFSSAITSAMNAADAAFVLDKQDQREQRERFSFAKPIYVLSRWAGSPDSPSSAKQRRSLLICCQPSVLNSNQIKVYLHAFAPFIEQSNLKLRLLCTGLSSVPIWLSSIAKHKIDVVDECSLTLSHLDETRLLLAFDAGDKCSSIDEWVHWAAERRVPAMVTPMINLRLEWELDSQIGLLKGSAGVLAKKFQMLVLDDSTWQQASEAAYNKAMLISEAQQNSREIIDAVRDKLKRLVSFHEGKTAGSSLMNILKEVYTPSIQFFYGDHRDTEVADPMCFHGHLVRRAVQHQLRRAPLITFYREPLDRAISFFFYQMDLYKLTPDDFLPWLELRRDYSTVDPKTGEIRTLVRPSCKNAMTGCGFRYESFDLIGITEHFELSAKLMGQLLNWPDGLDLLSRENVGVKRPAAIELDDEVVQRYKHRYAADYELYNRAKKELFRKARIAGLDEFIP